MLSSSGYDELTHTSQVSIELTFHYDVVILLFLVVIFAISDEKK